MQNECKGKLAGTPPFSPHIFVQRERKFNFARGNQANPNRKMFNYNLWQLQKK